MLHVGNRRRTMEETVAEVDELKRKVKYLEEQQTDMLEYLESLEKVFTLSFAHHNKK